MYFLNISIPSDVISTITNGRQERTLRVLTNPTPSSFFRWWSRFPGVSLRSSFNWMKPTRLLRNRRYTIEKRGCDWNTFSSALGVRVLVTINTKLEKTYSDCRNISVAILLITIPASTKHTEKDNNARYPRSTKSVMKRSGKETKPREMPKMKRTLI
jgi:hypothetical protein